MRSHRRGTSKLASAGRRSTVLAASVTVAALAIAGCSSSEEPPTTTTAAAATSGTTSGTKAPGTTSTTKKTSGTTPGTTKTNGTTPRGTTVDTPNADIEPDEVAPTVTWALNAQEYQGQNGLLVAYDCTPDGSPTTVWGTEVYTDDSSVCSAAVHAGLITVADGGLVVIEITPGEESYVGSTANGITTNDYASWPGSFIFPGTAGGPRA